VGGRVNDVYVKRNDQVKAGQLLADLETETNEFAVRRAQTQLDIARINLEMTKLNTPVYAKEYKLLIALREKEVEMAQIAVDEMDKAVASTRIVAPYDGTVMSLSVSQGSLAEAFKVVFMVADLTKLEVTADVTGEDLNKLEEGMPVKVSPVSSPGKAQDGVIRRLPYPIGKNSGSTPEDKADKSTHITLNVDPIQSGLELGSLTTITAVQEQHSHVLWLPPQAVRKFDGRNFVIVQEADGQRRVDVKTGIFNQDRIEILEGLSEGQIVVAP
jgi:macrolide-specific efflux system membrane fusion protein